MKRTALRSAIAFFLVTFSTAFLATIGARLTGWFTSPLDLAKVHIEELGVTIMAGVIVLAVGAGVRRMDAAELRSALLGAASVLLAIPTSSVAILHVWPNYWTIITILGVVLLGCGFLVAATHARETSEAHE
jgi:hypothetical protein